MNDGNSETTKCTACNAVHGVDPRMSCAGEPTTRRDQAWVSGYNIQATMQRIHELLRLGIRRSQAVQQETANRGRVPAPNIQEGSQVWLDAGHIWTTRPRRKFDWKPSGPYTVVRRISLYVYELELPSSIRVHQIQPVSHLDTVVNDPLNRPCVNLAPPVAVEAQEEYQVSSGDHSQMNRSQLRYHIRWTGYDSLTWEPAKFGDGLQALEEFRRRYSMKPGPLDNVLGEPRT